MNAQPEKSSEMHWVDAAIHNARSGYCMCGSSEGVQRGRSPFGYGPVCVDCQRKWEEIHGVRWASEKECKTLDDAVAARLRADGVDDQTIIRMKNRRLAPFVSDHGGTCGPAVDGQCRYFGMREVPR